MLKLRPLDLDTYKALRISLLQAAEERRDSEGNPILDKTVYFDGGKDGVGFPTIGIGMNLRDDDARPFFAKWILARYGVVDNQKAITAVLKQIEEAVKAGSTFNTAAKLQSELDRIIADQTGNPFATAKFLDDNDVKDACTGLNEAIYEQRIDNWYGSKIDYSHERLALLSLAYNGGLGSNLRTAIQNGNRPEAWYQIRYETNGNKLAGLAKRRYYESALFGLYDNPTTTSSTITEAEAKSIFVALGDSSHQERISSYDEKYRHVPVYKKVNGQKIQTSEKDLLEAANADYHTDIVQTYDAAISPAFNFLVSKYAPDQVINQVLVDSGTGNSLLDEGAVATGTNTLILGEAGNAVYYFRSLSGSDVVSDVDTDGTLIISNGKRSTKLTGNALPKVSSSGTVSWTLGGFELHEVRGSLVVTKPGADISSASTPRITIKSFPFTQSAGAFGITLGKKMDKAAGVETSTNSLSADVLLPYGANPSTAGTNKFFGMLRSNVDSLLPDSLATFDSFGNQLSEVNIDDKFAQYSSSAVPQISGFRSVTQPFSYTFGGKKYYAYQVVGTKGAATASGVSYSRVGALLTDIAGNIVASQVYADGTVGGYDGAGDIISGYGIYIPQGKTELYCIYQKRSGSARYNTDDVGVVVQKINPTTLEKIGNPISYSNHDWGLYGSPIYGNYDTSSQINPNDFTLASGTEIKINNGIADDGQYKTIVTSLVPKLRDLLPSEIIPNSDLASGTQTTDSSASKAILAFNADEETELKLTQAPTRFLRFLEVQELAMPTLKSVCLLQAILKCKFIPLKTATTRLMICLREGLIPQPHTN